MILEINSYEERCFPKELILPKMRSGMEAMMIDINDTKCDHEVWNIIVKGFRSRNDEMDKEEGRWCTF